MKGLFILALTMSLAHAVWAQDKFTVSGTPIPSDLVKQNYGQLPKGVNAYDLSICNVTTDRQAMVSSQIYQSLAQSNLSLKPIGRQIMLASILRNQRRSAMTILNVALTAGTGVFALLSTSKTMNVPDSAKTVIALGSLLFGQVTASLQPVLPADKVEKFDREVLEPSLVLDGGSCVERTVFASLDDGSTKTPALVFHVR